MATKPKYVKKEPVKRVPFKPSYPPSEEQDVIFNQVKNTSDNIHIEASPGSGKSTTLVWTMTFDKTPRSAMVAFGKDIVTDIEPRCAPHVVVGTCHSFGRQAVAGEFGNYLFLQQDKVRNVICKEYPKLNPFEASDKEKGPAFSKMNHLVNLVNMLRVNLTDETDVEAVMNIANQYNIEVIDDSIELLPNIFNKMIENPKVIDFPDMIWLPIRMNLNIRKFDMVYFDERQDANSMMIELVKRMSGGRIITVGDKHQCQPPDTMVMFDNGASKPISEIKVGDRVVSYHSSGGYVEPRARVSEVAKRPYFGDMYHVSAGTKITRSTPNHKWYVKWSEKAKEKHCVYLMLKDNQFRIGRSQLFYKVGSTFQFGPMCRGRAEKIDAVWILKITDTRNEASVYENFYSYKFQIPQLVFVDNNINKEGMDQSAIDQFWNLFGCNYDKGIELLEHLNLSLDHPFKDGTDVMHCGPSNSFFVHAYNLIPDIMMVPTFDTYTPSKKTVSDQWEEIRIEIKHYSGMVHSLNVDRSHTYVADGMLTGNSIMAWSGADLKSTERLVAAFPGQELGLNTCYRCGTDIVELAAKIYDKIKPYDKNPKGEIVYRDTLDMDMPEGSMILSRRNANLIKPCFDLLKAGRKAIIKGKDIGAGMASLINQMKAFDLNDLRDKLEAYRFARIEKLMDAKEVKVASIESVNDTCDCILVLADNCSSIEDISRKIDQIFAQDTKGITLSSIHRSKGREAHMVSIIDYNRIRLNHDRMNEEDHIQEANLEFVALTRAIDKLHIIGA